MAVRSHDTRVDDKYLNADGNKDEALPTVLDIHDQGRLRSNVIPKPANIQLEHMATGSTPLAGPSSVISGDDRQRAAQ